MTDQPSSARPVSLAPVTAANWEAVVALKVNEDQQGLVAPNLYSVAQAQFLPGFVARAVHASGELVGFVLYGPDPDDGGCPWLYRLMIDGRFQGRGYGRAAMLEVIRDVRGWPGARDLTLGYAPHNEAARRLYASLGFRETGEVIGGETIARLDLTSA